MEGSSGFIWVDVMGFKWSLIHHYKQGNVVKAKG